MKRITSLFLLFNIAIKAQIIMPNVYTQNFGSTDITSWTDNSTYSGWYIQGTGTPTFQSHLNITSTAAPTNNGGWYSYECSSNNDQKIGTRPSNGAVGGVGTTGGVTNGIYIGARFINNSGNVCTSIKVSYTGFQMSLSENQNNVNKYVFSYKISASSITSLISTGWTAVSSLDYTAPNNDNTAGSSNQLSAYICTQSTAISACFSGFTIPNGSEIMLRWADANDAANDPHLAIDNVQVEFFKDNVCAVVLPIELIDFYATKNEKSNDIIWKVAQEENILYYTVEKSNDAVNFTDLTTVYASNEMQTKTYSINDGNPFDDITYYRLSTKETNGLTEYFNIISVDQKDLDWQFIHYQNENKLVFEFKNTVIKNSTISLYDLSGKLILSQKIESYNVELDISNVLSGIYIAKIETPYKIQNLKIAIQH